MDMRLSVTAQHTLVNGETSPEHLQVS